MAFMVEEKETFSSFILIQNRLLNPWTHFCNGCRGGISCYTHVLVCGTHNYWWHNRPFCMSNFEYLRHNSIIIVISMNCTRHVCEVFCITGICGKSCSTRHVGIVHVYNNIAYRSCALVYLQHHTVRTQMPSPYLTPMGACAIRHPQVDKQACEVKVILSTMPRRAISYNT